MKIDRCFVSVVSVELLTVAVLGEERFSLAVTCRQCREESKKRPRGEPSADGLLFWVAGVVEPGVHCAIVSSASAFSGQTVA